MSTANAAQPLQGRTALVVQANAGVGAAVAEAFAAAGAKVMINYLHENAGADQVAQRIRVKQGLAMIFQADISQESQVRSMFDVLVAYWGGLDILVTNADLEIDTSALDIKQTPSQTVLTQNLAKQFLCVRQALRAFSRQGGHSALPDSAGNIICVSSLRNALSPDGRIAYSVSKPSMSSLSKAFATTLDQENTNIDLTSADFPSLAECRYANQEDVAKIAVDLATAVYGDPVRNNLKNGGSTR
ncbi:SDR family NAD(P)-dependent oxidoreductase [Methylomonas sp. 11b]|uniref:SDR family NAD(P)-dependent oxidoreductase n=1 Tax=Methylomonas sp. 11b TaxID=1168169 RepID=UPI00047A83FE|nr:SDR family NAD(P)-dependent oxidoreductase [Methylomonas sp. 11b]